MNFRSGAGITLGLALAAVASVAQAQGFQLQQYEPVSAGEQGFAVAAPWYAPQRTFAAALTLDYGHDVLQGGRIDSDEEFSGETIIEHQLGAHVDLAYSPWDRLQLSLSLPVTLLEDGEARENVGPISSPAIGDPRLGASVRLVGDADRDAFSAHINGALWIPIGVEDDHAGDESVRGRIGAAFAGHAAKHLAWAANAGVLLRKQAGLNALATGPGTVGNELQLGARVGYASESRSFHVGPEATFGTVLGDDRTFKQSGSHLELLLGSTYWLAKSWQIGAAAGAGVVRSPGTPDLRGLLRIAYAPDFGDDQEPAAVLEPAPEPVVVATAPEPEPAPVEPTPAPEPEPVAEVAPPPPPPAAEPVAPPAEPVLKDLPRIRFARNQSNTPATADLDRAAARIKAQPNARIRVVGHSDDTGPASFNQELSEARARFVADALIARGVPASSLEVSGVGSSQPRAAATTEQGRAQNRRVELSASE
jgi:outer membrane protein OmpA-like peptidoglycan-associated protein